MNCQNEKHSKVKNVIKIAKGCELVDLYLK